MPVLLSPAPTAAGIGILLLAGLAAAAAATAVPAAAAVPVADWRICDEGVLTVTGGEVEPLPAHAGQEVVFRIHGDLDREVAGGVLEVWVDYLGFHVHSERGDMCKALRCPLAAGPLTLEFRQQLPKAAPPGPYLGVFQATATDGTLLFCLDINFRIALRAAST